MKIAVVENTSLGGSQYSVIPTNVVGNLPVGRIGAMEIVEVDDVSGQKLIDRQADSIRLQLELQNLYYEGDNRNGRQRR